MTRALIWSLWQRGRWHVLLLGPGLAIFATLFLSFVRPDDDLRRAQLCYGMLALVVICLAIDLLHLAEGTPGAGFDTRYFVLPVSSLRLAATWLMTLAAVPLGAYTVGGMAIAYGFEVPRPDLTRGIQIAALVASLVCVQWATPGRSIRRTVLMTLLVAAWVLPSMLTRTAGQPWNPLADLEGMSPIGLVVAISILVASIAIGTWIIARHRSGDLVSEPSTLPMLPRPERPRATVDTLGPSFASPFRALLWLDWREKGHLVPGLVFAPWLLLLGGGASGALDPPSFVSLVVGMVYATLFFGPVLVAGIICRVKDGVIGTQLDTMQTLRPVTSARLASVALTHGMLSLIFAWTFTGIVAWTTLDILGGPAGPGAVAPVVTRVLDSPDLGPRFGLFVAIALAAAWLQIGALSALLLTGRNRIAALLIVVPYAFGGALLAFRDAITRVPGDALLRVAPWIVGFAGLIGTAALIGLAIHKRLIDPRAFAWQAAALLAIVLLAASRFDLPSGAHGFAMLGLAVAVLAPWPATALSIRWNRHR